MIIVIVNIFSVFFQQYVMLHDMVATHSIVRVSVCRANDGLLVFPLISPQSWFLYSFFKIYSGNSAFTMYNFAAVDSALVQVKYSHLARLGTIC